MELNKSSSNVCGPMQAAVFSIATPAVTSMMPDDGLGTQSSFLQPCLVSHDTIDQPPALAPIVATSARPGLGLTSADSPTQAIDKQDMTQTNESNATSNHHPAINHELGSSQQDNNSASDGDTGKSIKKRIKAGKKNVKLDAKSKLEKSRQSARECRARKKLRYQYLEDLVCNREKAVVKLREELSMFCDLAKRIDAGIVTDADKKLIMDQTKDNTQRG